MLPLRIAWRYLKSKKTHNAVNIISIVATLGVVVATAALVLVLSVFNGFRDMVEQRLSRLDPPIAITAATGKVIVNADSVMAAVSALEGVEAAFPTVDDQALAVFADYQMPVRLKGVPDIYHRYNALDDVVLSGSSRLEDGVARYALVASGPAIRLHVQPQSLRMLRLFAPMRQGRVNLANPVDAFVEDSLFVGAVFQVQQAVVDDDLIIVPIDFARDLFDYPSEASVIEVHTRPGANVDALRDKIIAMLGDSYRVDDRLMQQAESFRLINIEKWVTFLLLAFILVIATFNVVSTLALLIVEKRESTATLRALGASTSLTRAIFACQAWLITGLGAVVGIIIGILLALGQQTFGWVKLAGDPSRLIVDAYPVKVIPSDILIVLALAAAVALLTSVITSLIARRAT